MKKIRLDKFLTDRGLAPSREKAQGFIMAGCVFVGGNKITKPGQMIAPDSVVRVEGRDHPFVSRGGVKLAHALEKFALDVKNKVCMDVGASTGGFTDCLLQNGAARVYAVDVGYGQIDWKLATDKRVVVIERTNVRKMGHENIPEAMEIVVVDVSFISVTLVFPVVDIFLKPGGMLVALIKPQFEVGRGLVGKGGIVRDCKLHELATVKVREAGLKLGWSCEGIVDSPITGAKGNREFLIYFRKPLNFSPFARGESEGVVHHPINSWWHCPRNSFRQGARRTRPEAYLDVR